MTMRLRSKIPEADLPADRIDGQNTVIDVAGGDYVWRDEKSNFVVKATSGTNNPLFETISGVFQGLTWSGSAMTQVWVDFHIDHDYAVGTMIYPHVHWMPLTTATGTVRWGFDYSIAKGHGRSKFFQSVNPTVYVNHTFTTNSQFMHMVTEFPQGAGILSTELEPDSVIVMRVFRDGAVDSYNGKVHAWQADLHYQVARIGTKNRLPNFFV